jgi:hypothetical protein
VVVVSLNNSPAHIHITPSLPHSSQGSDGNADSGLGGGAYLKNGAKIVIGGSTWANNHATNR